MLTAHILLGVFLKRGFLGFLYCTNVRNLRRANGVSCRFFSKQKASRFVYVAYFPEKYDDNDLVETLIVRFSLMFDNNSIIGYLGCCHCLTPPPQQSRFWLADHILGYDHIAVVRSTGPAGYSRNENNISVGSVKRNRSTPTSHFGISFV